MPMYRKRLKWFSSLSSTFFLLFSFSFAFFFFSSRNCMYFVYQVSLSSRYIHVIIFTLAILCHHSHPVHFEIFTLPLLFKEAICADDDHDDDNDKQNLKNMMSVDIKLDEKIWNLYEYTRIPFVVTFHHISSSFPLKLVPKMTFQMIIRSPILFLTSNICKFFGYVSLVYKKHKELTQLSLFSVLFVLCVCVWVCLNSYCPPFFFSSHSRKPVDYFHCHCRRCRRRRHYDKNHCCLCVFQQKTSTTKPLKQ